MHFYTLNTATAEMLIDDELGQYVKREELGPRLTVQDNVCQRAISGYLLQTEPVRRVHRR